MHTASADLFSNSTGAGNGATVPWPGGRGVVTAEGTWGGSSLGLEYQGPHGSWIPVTVLDPADATSTALALTANGMFLFELPPGKIRGVLTGGTPSAFYATAARIPY